MNKKISYAILIAGTVLMIILSILVCMQVIIETQNNFNTFSNAPECNTSQKIGICKYDNTSWIKCRNATYLDFHKGLKCEIIYLYDVRT
jgi:hypothetical protein